ncbi:MAG: class I SAM-dependent methyltransferase [Pseudomonadota bacterium]|nr:class I SAM-dependent methyltransferase [Pseudomonadota bacterium]
MDPKAYLEMADTEDRHWWFVGRRAVLRDLIGAFKMPSTASILEVGSGTGGNLEMLCEFGEVKAMELDAHARELAIRKTQGRVEVRAGRCPDDIAFADQRFNLICMFDVLEHVEEDVATLAALRRSLASGGRLLVTVPAFSWLWSTHDEFLHHKRRYTAHDLEIKCAAAGLKMERVSYFNTFLFPLGVLARVKDRLVRSKVASGVGLPASPVNFLLRQIFSMETVLLRRMNLPFGMSLLAVLQVA